MSVPPKSDADSTASSDAAPAKKPARSRLTRGAKKPAKAAATKELDFSAAPAPAPAPEPPPRAP